MLFKNRQKMTHDRVFDNHAFAAKYADGHRKFSKKISSAYIRRLRQMQFTEGKILDAGCGPGYESIVIKKAFPKADITGIDLAQPLLDVAIQGAKKRKVVRDSPLPVG